MKNLIRRISFRRSDELPFNGIKAIQAHLDHRTRIESYVNGLTNQHPDENAICKIDCILGKSLHDGQGAQKMNLNLVNQACNSCEIFHEAAAQVVLHFEMGQREWAKSALVEGQTFHKASDDFQKNLAELHVASWLDTSTEQSDPHLSFVSQ